MENILLDKPDDRTIYWIYDPNGCCGKSEFLKYMVVKHKTIFTNVVKEMILLI
jgi:hypothetical protein